MIITTISKQEEHVICVMLERIIKKKSENTEVMQLKYRRFSFLPFLYIPCSCAENVSLQNDVWITFLK